jgi:CBS domain-containing protein
MDTKISRDRSALPVSQVMSTEPISVERDAHLATARYLLRLAKHAAIVVLDDHEPRRPVGVLAEGDVVAAVADGEDPNEACVADIVVKQPLSVESAASVREAALAMLTNGVKYLPVVDGERLVGIVAVRDVQNGM